MSDKVTKSETSLISIVPENDRDNRMRNRLKYMEREIGFAMRMINEKHRRINLPGLTVEFSNGYRVGVIRNFDTDEVTAGQYEICVWRNDNGPMHLDIVFPPHAVHQGSNTILQASFDEVCAYLLRIGKIPVRDEKKQLKEKKMISNEPALPQKRQTKELPRRSIYS